jgi:glyoxylase-like metal-dependent hydrolase (beta-lactamase superfamily II)
MTSDRAVTTSMMIRRGDRVVLVDPAWSVGELDSIVQWIDESALIVTAGFHTHAHHDHLLWHPAFGTAPRWISSRTAEMALEWRSELLDALGDEFPREWPNPLDSLLPTEAENLPEPFGVDAPNEQITLIRHDGHAPGHTAIWLPERRALLAGDMLSDVELPLPFSPDDLSSYLDALDKLAPFVAMAVTLVPGHGHPTDRPMKRLDADRSYLDAVVAGRDPDDPRRGLPGMDEAHRRIVELARDLPKL